MKHRVERLALCLAMLCAPLVVHADEPSAQVARVSYTGGEVSYQRGDSDGWNALEINTPLVTGDALYTSDDGRAEVHLGGGNVLRMDAGTQVDLLSNTHDLEQLGMRSGYLDLRARSLSGDGTLEIDTPSGAATVLEPGVYRVALSDRGARYSVVKGRLSVSVNGRQLDVAPDHTLTVEGADQPSYSFDHLAPELPIDRWATERDARAERSRSARYVHHDVVGYEDLDANGTWRETTDYGRVWTPLAIPSNWAPYQAGRWMWQDPFGWTWVSNEPWGWAPYHYGRWVSVGGTWGWVPPPPVGFHGPTVVAEIRPTYAPALVAFVGGQNWSAGVSLGGGPAIGWVPLAPAEHYYFPWQSAPRVTSTYTNMTVVNAVTIVNTTNFATGPIHPIHARLAQVIHAPFIGYTATEVVPTRESLCPSRPRDPHSKFVPRREDDRPLVVRTQPPPKPVPFHDRVAEIQRSGRPSDAHDRGEHARVENEVVTMPPPERVHANARPAMSVRSQPSPVAPEVSKPAWSTPKRTPPAHASEPAVPVMESDPSRAHAATSVHEWHVSAPEALMAHPVTTTSVAPANHVSPHHEAPKPEARKATDEKAKGKEGHMSREQQQDH